MQILETKYKKILENPNIPSTLLKELTDKAQQERWVFVGT